MDGRKDFTIDPINFVDLPALVDEVKKDGLRFGIILDPAIMQGYPPFRRGDKSKVFVQWANSSYKPEGQDANDDNLYGRVSRVSYAITREETISQAYSLFVQ
jgi:maltase-glucoamylase